jgi:hypothetical protein
MCEGQGGAMKGEIVMRQLSTGDFFIFAKSTKNLYLIESKHVGEWRKSDQSQATLRKMIRARKARRFGPQMLSQLQTAVSKINFKI